MSSSAPWRRRVLSPGRRRAGASLAIGAFLALLWLPLLAGHDAIPWDGSRQFAPAFALTGEAARAGELRLWDPWVAGGWPLAADPQFGAYSPLVLAFAALSGGAEWGLRAYVVTLWIALGIGWHLLGRRLGAPAAAAVAVGLALATSGAALSHAEHASWLSAYALLPWILERAVAACGGRARAALAAGALWGLQALAGYPSIVLGTAFMLPLALLAMPRRRPRRRPGARPRRRLLAAAAGALIALLVALPALVALTGEAPGFSDRARPLSEATQLFDNAYPPGAAVSFASPYLAVLALLPGSTFSGIDPSLVSLWLGAVPPLLALAALALRPATPRLVALLAAAAALFVLALPGSPLRAFLAAWVPPVRYFRHGAMFKDLASFALALAALSGARVLAAATRGAGAAARRRVPIAVAAFALLALAGALAVLARPVEGARRVALARTHAAAAWGLGALAVAGWAGAGPERRRHWSRALVALALADAGASVALARPLAVDSGGTRSLWDELARERRRGSDLQALGFARAASWRVPEAGTGPTNTNVVVKRATWDGYLALASRRHAEVVATGALDPLVAGEQRLWFAPGVARVAPDDRAWAAWRGSFGSGELPPLVVHSRREMTRGSGRSAGVTAVELESLPRLAALPQRVERYLPERLEISFRAPEAGWILVSDRWAPGWRATIDGVPAVVEGGNFLFRALEVAAGEHRVAMSYRPSGYPWAVALSWALLTLVAALALPGARSATPERDPAWLLYDGTCGLCDRSVQWLLRRDRRGALRFARLEGPIGGEVRARHPGLPPAGASLLLVVSPGVEGERIYSRSSGVLRAVARLGGAYSAAALLLAVPRFLRDAAYDGVARNRIRWFGRLPACRIPTAGERSRFLDPE